MREKEQEGVASSIVGLHVNDRYSEWEDLYPQLMEITDLASDLEWSNVANTTIAWRRIKELVDELEEDVATKSNKQRNLPTHSR